MRATLCAVLIVASGCGRAAPVATDAGYAFPALTGRVVDAANVVPAAREAALADRLLALESRTGHQLVVATVTTLGGHIIEDYGLHLGRTWGIGRKDVNDGVILLVAPNERRVRIEVGTGLERALKDEEADHILQAEVLPAFRVGDYPGGIDAGVTGILREIDQP